ncbi:MAG: hypothetical protein V3U62_07965 [Sedimenticolaceae bacterium]
MGARKLIEQAIEAELQALLSQLPDNKLTECGYAAVVGNGCLPERVIQTGIGPTVKVPKLRSRSGDPITFHAASVPSIFAKPVRWKPRFSGCISRV